MSYFLVWISGPTAPISIPSSVEFGFRPILMDGIKERENTVTPTGELAAYIENTHRGVVWFAVCAFEFHRQEFATKNV